MKSYGRASLYEFLQDRLVYRNLRPVDPSLPGLEQIRSHIGLDENAIPRKNQADYARVILNLLEACRRQDSPGRQIERLVFVGDTRLLDGTAFANLCAVSGLPGLAFIGSEDAQPPAPRLVADENRQTLFLANRWSMLGDFDRFCREQGQPVDEATAIVVDVDKTAVGARGRNAQVIDQARMQAVEETVAGALGPAFDPSAFRSVYQPLNQPDYHFFTGDNQDYLAYICLMLSSGQFSFAELKSRLQAGQIESFDQFITEVEKRRAEIPVQLAQIHADIYARVRLGDPTPFKAFRRREYLLTLRRFGCLEDSAPLERMLAEEILVTQEVRQAALEWKRRGALLFGLSDKPDEASLPTPEQAAQGFLPLHRAETHAVGE